MVKIWYTFVVLVGIGYWLVWAVVWFALKLLSGFTFRGREKERVVFGRRVIRLHMRWFVEMTDWLGVVKYDREELMRLGEIEGPMIVAPTHPSLLDAVFMIAGVPQLGCIMKADIVHNPVLASGASLAGFIPNAPALAMFRSAKTLLRDGGSLLVFPEGTRTEVGAGLNPFKPAAAAVATAAGVPVLPVYMRTNSGFLGKGWPLWKLPNHPIRFRMSIGEKIWPEEGESSQEFNQRLEVIYRERMEEFE